MEKKFNIEGMTCSACQAHIQKAVEKLDGLTYVNVNLLKNTMDVKYDEKNVDFNNVSDLNASKSSGKKISHFSILE